MSDEEVNHVQLEAQLVELEPLRRTPAGQAVAACMLQHASRQQEAGVMRDVRVEIKAIAIGDLAAYLAAANVGMMLRVSGFLAAKSLRSRAPILHLSTIEFLEGN